MVTLRLNFPDSRDIIMVAVDDASMTETDPKILWRERRIDIQVTIPYTSLNEFTRQAWKVIESPPMPGWVDCSHLSERKLNAVRVLVDSL